MKKRLIAAFLALAMLFGLTGCSAANLGSKKTEITMFLWDKTITRQLTPWLEEQFPDISFTFIVGYNTMAYYADLTERGEDIPDIITCRRFSLNDASHMADQLMDLSETEIVGPSMTATSKITVRPMVRSAGCQCVQRWTASLQTWMYLRNITFRFRPTMPNLCLRLMPSRRSVSAASTPTGTQITPVWKPCRAVPFRS